MPGALDSLMSLLFGQATDARSERWWISVRAPLSDDDQVLQSYTHHWLRCIPSGRHPKQLCRYFPRIANCIAVHWHDAVTTGHLLTDLMVDRRGGRRGFPPRVAADILGLHRQHARRLALRSSLNDRGRGFTQGGGGHVPSPL